MKNSIKYALICDGSSDSTLLEIIGWLFNDLYPTVSANGSYCDFTSLREPPRQGAVAERVRVAEYLTNFDICFYHRDAEKFSVKHRTSEIRDSLTDEQNNVVICVIPVQMMESWLLIDREAIKKAAENRNYTGNMDLPKLGKIETLRNPNAKCVLESLLTQATGNTGRRLSSFNVKRAIHLVAEYIEDYSPLRKLTAFRAFEADMRRVVDRFLNTTQ